MAEKTTKAEKLPVERIEPADPWQEMREIYVPPKGDGDQEFLFVGVNGRVFQVPCSGEVQRVPLPIYEVLINAKALQQEAEARAAAELKKMQDSARAVNLPIM